MAFRSLVTETPAVDSPDFPPNPFLPIVPDQISDCDQGNDGITDEEPLKALNLYTLAYGGIVALACLCCLGCCCLR